MYAPWTYQQVRLMSSANIVMASCLWLGMEIRGLTKYDGEPTPEPWRIDVLILAIREDKLIDELYSKSKGS